MSTSLEILTVKIHQGKLSTWGRDVIYSAKNKKWKISEMELRELVIGWEIIFPSVYCFI